MRRRLRVLGLGVLALAATGCLSAQGASAARLAGSAEAVKIHGAQATGHEWVFTDNNNLKLTCTTATFEGSIPSGGTSTPVVHPTYSGCTCFGLNCTVHTTGCDYEYHLGTFNAAGTPASTDIECGTGAIRITALTCEIDIPTQQGLTSTTFTNQASDVLIDTSLKKITYEVTKDGIGCPLIKVGHFTEGDYNGTTTLTAASGTLQVQP